MCARGVLMLDRWFQVEEEPGLPRGLCRLCSEDTIAASHFRQLCAEAATQWQHAATSLALVNPPDSADKAYYIFYNGDGETVIRDQIRAVKDPHEAFERLTETIQPPKDRKERKKLGRLKCSCPDCGKPFVNAAELNFHLKKTTRRVCFHCGAIKSRAALSRHLLRAHNKAFLSCPTCYKLFEKEDDLRSHCDVVHGPKSHACHNCGQGFPNERGLRSHMFSHTLFHCNSAKCTKSFENRKCYKHHKKQCVAELPSDNGLFTCDYCGSSYNKKPSLRIHIVQKHLNVLPYVCSTCGKRTSTLAHLKSHQTVHKTERQTFHCFVCGAIMRTELGYALHQRIHTGEKPYQCSECGDKFLSASRRLDHIKRRHKSTHEMAHGCAECPARFIRPGELRKHVANTHWLPDGDPAPPKHQGRRFRRHF